MDQSIRANPLTLLLAPLAVLLVTGVLSGLLTRWNGSVAWLACVVGAWLAFWLQVFVWPGSRGIDQVDFGSVGAGIDLVLRLDALGAWFATILLLGGAILLSVQARNPVEAWPACLALMSGLLAIESGGLLVSAIGLGTAATVLLALMERDPAPVPSSFRLVLPAASILIVWAGVLAQTDSATDRWAALPPTLIASAFGLVPLVAGLLLTGFLPGLSWSSHLETGSRRSVALLGVAVMIPVGFYYLSRFHGSATGGLPAGWLEGGESAVGLVALGIAAMRAQAAKTPAQYFGDLVGALSGLALLGLGSGSTLGLVATMTTIPAIVLVLALVPLLPAGRPRLLAFTAALAVGAPPSLVFTAWLLTIQNGIELGGPLALVAVAAGLGWLILAFAGARAAHLKGGQADEGSRAARIAIGGGLVGGSLLVGWPQSAILVPMLAASASGGEFRASYAGFASASGAFPALSIGIVILLLGGLLMVIGRGSDRGHSPAPLAAPLAIPPLISIPGRLVASSLLGRFPRLALGELGLPRPTGAEAVMARGSIWFWIVLFGVLAYVTRR